MSNYPNVTIPTNYDVAETARDQFGAFYAALLDRTIAETPGAVVTEYAWDSSSCDPCPTPPLDDSAVVTLGADALNDAPPPPPTPPPRLESSVTLGDVTSGNKVPGAAQVMEGMRQRLLGCFAAERNGTPGKGEIDVTLTLGAGGKVTQVKTGLGSGASKALAACVVVPLQAARFDAPKGGTIKTTLAFEARVVQPAAPPRTAPRVNPYGFTLTRLHARYTRDALGQDLIFREVPPIEGGREDFNANQQAHGAKASGTNNFQARYVIRHPWTGPIACSDPKRGVWGGPPPGVQGDTGAKPALKVAFAPRGQVDLVGFLREGVPELKIPAPPPAPSVEPGARGCSGCSVPDDSRSAPRAALAALLAMLVPLTRRRRAAKR